MIELKNIKKSFSKREIFSDINIVINKGECIAIIGKSGIGKSVLLKHIVGLIKPDSGSVFIDNQNINGIPFKELQKVRSSIGMVFQFGALFDSMTVKENIGLALYKLSNLSKELINERIKDVLEAVHMSGTENLMPSELSGGMKKRVGIARAIAVRPKYILYDEPTTGLDPVMTDSINKLISKLHTLEKVTSIIVTHEMRTVYDVTDRVLMIHDGKIRFDGTSKNIKESEDLIVKNFIQGVSEKEFYKN